MPKKTPPKDVPQQREGEEKDPQTVVHQQAKTDFFAQNEALVGNDLKAAAKRHDMEEVENILLWYGAFLERHPEALARG